MNFLLPCFLASFEAVTINVSWETWSSWQMLYLGEFGTCGSFRRLYMLGACDFPSPSYHLNTSIGLTLP